MGNVLIVDDSEASVAAIVKHLENAGHVVHCVPNGRDALASVLAELPDVVLLDLLMPEMDGPTFLEVIRSYLRLQRLPVVILTAVPDSPMVDRARHLKVNSILTKGKASLSEIQHAVEEAIARVPG